MLTPSVRDNCIIKAFIYLLFVNFSLSYLLFKNKSSVCGMTVLPFACAGVVCRSPPVGLVHCCLWPP